MIGGNLSIESGAFATLNYTVSIPPYSFPPPERYIRLRVEARDDDSGFAWANVFERGEYESLGATPDITFLRYPTDSQTNMYGRGTNSLAALVLWQADNHLSGLRIMALVSLLIMLLGFMAFMPGVLGSMPGLKQRFFHLGWSLWFIGLSRAFFRSLTSTRLIRSSVPAASADEGLSSP